MNAYNRTAQEKQRLLRMSFTYTYGIAVMTRKELRDAKRDAESDPELRGTLREMVIERFNEYLKKR